MPQLTQTDCVIFYVTHDGLKGHTCLPGHTVKSPHDFLLVTEDREEWDAWHQCDHADCELCPEGCELCEENE